MDATAERTPPAGLYVHVPFCDGKCGYCAFYSVPYDSALADRFLDALDRERALRRRADAAGQAPDTVYIGGGTPSVLSPAQLERLCRVVHDCLAAGRRPREWTVEMNPGSLSPAQAAVLAAAGVNRISVGAQSFDDRVLRRLGRRHTAEDTRRAVALLRRAGFDNIGLDLLAAVPGVSRALWRATLREALALAPCHVSVYALTYEEGTRLGQGAVRGAQRPLSDTTQLAMLDAAETRLRRAGLRRYEISNYARPGFECRHHLDVWRGAEYLGMGPAAASHVGRRRWTNRPDLAAYLAALESGRRPPRDEERVSSALERQDRLIFGLRLTDGVPEELADGYLAGLRALRADGLAIFRAGRWRLTRRGFRLADYAAVELMRSART